MAAAMFTISYPCAVAVSVIGGFAWDVTGIPVIAFVPIGICAFALAALPLTVDFRQPAD
jgi:CP family cyanate transporter-like MFS transporter